jgi:hypothetical protein
MDILKRLPQSVADLIKYHFKSPIATMIEEHWKEPVKLRKRWVLAQLNRFNWITHSASSHNYGNSILLRVWAENPNLINGALAWKLKVLDVLDIFTMNQHLNILVPSFREQNKILKNIWTCPVKNKDLLTSVGWEKRSLFGGVYPINRRPRVRVPRNPWTNAWNLRWKPGSELWKLCNNSWDRDPWRMCRWGGAGTVVKKLNGDNYIFMGTTNIDFIPINARGIDVFI